jgi:hypothetical protein
VARILIVGGGCRGRRLAVDMVSAGHAVRVTTRSEEHRVAIEATGAECWIGTPDRLATLRSSLANVTVACWMLGTATGEVEQVRALHTTRLEFFLTQAIDTTARGFVYEAAGTVPGELLVGGERIARAMGARNAIPLAVLSADPADVTAWLRQAGEAIAGLLAG